MAKNGKLRLIGLGLTIFVIIAGIITNFVWAQADIKAVNVKADDLKEDGCKPAQTNGADMKLVEFRLNSIDKGMGEFRTEQREMRTENKQAFEAIMEKL